MKAVFIINDFKSMNLEKDTSIFLIKEAQKMDIATYAFDTSDILVKNGKVFVNSKKVVLLGSFIPITLTYLEIFLFKERAIFLLLLSTFSKFSSLIINHAD